MADDDLDWLSDLRWRGYPHLMPVRDIASEEAAMSPVEALSQSPIAPTPDLRLGELSRDNEALRSRIHGMGRAAEEFERRLREAGQSYEGALLETESRLRELSLDKERMGGELTAARAELARLNSRDAAREADLRLERERRADAEKALVLARRQIEELVERLTQSKDITGQDIALFRKELSDFIAQLHQGPDAAWGKA